MTTVVLTQSPREVTVTENTISVALMTGLPGPQGLPGTIVAVQNTPPLLPSIGDLWVDTT